MMNPSNSIQTCMETSDWLKGIVSEEGSMVEPSPPQMLPDRRLRPPQDQALKCPRCDSTHTKFCYYNNYSLSQPRYFCKTCRRYWTKGGSLRNVPVGGGCRKNKRSGASGKKLLADINSPLHQFQTSIGSSMLSQCCGTDLHLSFSGLLPPIYNLNSLSLTGAPREFDNFMECNHNVPMFESANHPRDNKLDAILGDPRNQIFSYTNVGDGVNECGGGGRGRLCDTDCHIFSPSMSLQGMSSLGFSMNGTHPTLMETCGTQRLALPFDPIDTSDVEVKSNGKMLSLEWQDQGCGEVGRESFGCNDVVGVWGVGNGSN